MKNNKKAFTLVELLIAMFIFAMLAVLLVPNVSNTAEKELFATQLKKVRNDLQQAMLLMTSQNQGTLEGFCAGGNSNACFIGEIESRLEVNVSYGMVMKNCTAAEIAAGECDENNQKLKYERDDEDSEEALNFEVGCENIDSGLTNPAKSIDRQTCFFVNKKPLGLNNVSFANTTLAPGYNRQFSALNLADGATVTVNFDSACANDRDLSANNAGTTKVCGYMAVDVNAGRGPDTLGKDIFFFWITAKEGLVPFGEIDQYDAANHCASGKDGLGCAYRVIREGKINYY